MAGDLFDTPRAAGEILDWTAEQLGRARCPVVILPGNHDWHEDQSPFLRVDFEQQCPNVHVLDEPDGEVLLLEDLGAAIFGRPVLNHASSFRPIADLPARPDVGWCIVMGHGLVVDTDHPTHRGRYREVQAELVPVVYGRYRVFLRRAAGRRDRRPIAGAGRDPEVDRPQLSRYRPRPLGRGRGPRWRPIRYPRYG